MNDAMLRQSTLLIIDDTPDNIMVLLNFLTDAGFIVLVAQDGKEGVEIAEYAHPDLILLDVMMPHMDGFEVCQRLKSQTITQDIPIIFMTALTDTTNKIKGFHEGATDYITKPLQHEEVLARVNTHLKVYRLQQQLAERTRQLEERTIELEKRNMELDAFAHTVAHDLKNPMNTIINLTDVLITDCCRSTPSTPHIINSKLHYIAQAGRQATDIIDALLLLAGVTKQAKVEIESLRMSEIVAQVLQQRLAYMIRKYRGDISVPNDWPVAQGYAPWVEEIWVNYVSNGLKYGGQQPILKLGATSQEDGMIRFWVRDNGPGLTKEQQARLFTPFNRLHKQSIQSSGLGLSIVQQIVEKLGGQAGVESEPGKGSLFYFTLPVSGQMANPRFLLATDTDPDN